MKKNILIYTSSRADYNPLQNIITEFQKSKKFNSLIVATGQHNDHKSGNTIQEIRDNHKIKILKIKHPIGLRNAANISKSKSIIVEKISKILRKYKPQLLVLLGDRYELLPCAMTCVQYKVPIAHIHGGKSDDFMIGIKIGDYRGIHPIVSPVFSPVFNFIMPDFSRQHSPMHFLPICFGFIARI